MRRGRVRSRGRRKKITYDSNETKTIFGLLLLLTGVIGILSNFADGLVFGFFRDLFGGSVTFFSISVLALALRFLGVAPNAITPKTVIGLTLISFSFAAFLTGDIDLPPNAEFLAYEGRYGGIVGYGIAEFIGNNLFREAIKPLAFVIIFFSMPLVFSMKLSEYIEKIKGIFGFISNKAKDVKTSVAKTSEKAVTPITEDNAINNATMVGDFRKAKTGSFVGKGPEFLGVEGELAKKKEKHETYGEKHHEVGSISVPSGELVPKEVNVPENGALVNSKLIFPDWKLPPVDLLKEYPNQAPTNTGVEKNKKIIEQTLLSFGVNAKVVDVLIGPTVTQYALDIALGTKVSKIANLRSDLALALATSADSVRVEAPIPGTSYVGIEIPNEKRQMISFKELVIDHKINSGHLMVTIGRDIAGEVILADIQQMPHLLIAGATGSGKSVVTNSFIMSLLMKKTPDEVRFIMVDPKQVEFSDYNGIPHLLTPVITDMDKVNNALKWAIVEMENRYTIFRETRVRNIEDYNKKNGYTAMPYIVIVIDEMADMMMSRGGAEIEASIVKLAQKARATGIHLILATQRPSVDVITGLIKANIPGRVGMSVTTQIDSRVILDQIGAESLLGRGDLLFKNPGKNRLDRIQGPYISQDEVIKVVNFIKEETPEDLNMELDVTRPIADPNESGKENESMGLSDDDLFIQAARIVINAGKGSSSLIQRKLSIGYNRAARLLDELYEHGIVGPENGSKPRDILVRDLDAYLAEKASYEQQLEAE